tara:strand:- start:201 stop:1049 length:849 start_codon:yes stop_codon:yes gene_type:complete
MSNLIDKKIVKASGRKDGFYRVVVQVKPVKVFGRDRRPPIDLMLPRDFDTGMEMLFAQDIVFREGDLVLLSGMSNFGKTCLCLNFCAENIKSNPVLMGNEYTTIDNEPSPRFLQRLDDMDWVEWSNGTGEDNFTLLPVHSDYAEHIVKDKLNIIDWINLPGEYYLISPVMEGIKRELGKGIGIIALQKNPGTDYGRGGNPSKDFADCELLLDALGEREVLLTIGKVKEPKKRVMGRTFGYGISKGVQIINFREVFKCPECHGKGWARNLPCQNCSKTGYIEG